MVNKIRVYGGSWKLEFKYCDSQKMNTFCWIGGFYYSFRLSLVKRHE